VAKRTRNSTSSSDKPANKSEKLDVCVKCNGAISDDCIACHWCGLWEHRNCANLKESELVMLDTGSQNILFFCSSCLPNLPKAFGLFEAQSQFDEKLEAKLQYVENKLHENMDNIETKLQEYQKSVLNTCDTHGQGLDNLQPLRSPISNDSVANITLSLTSEQKEKERRQFNIIVYNLKELNTTHGTARKQKDIILCSSIFSNYLNISVSIKMPSTLVRGIPDHADY